jgi:hypothetical protein
MVLKHIKQHQCQPVMLVDLEIQLEASNTKVSLHTMETIAPTCS